MSTVTAADLEVALYGMVEAHRETLADSDGQWPAPDAGCIICTCGTVPNHLNTGLCAYHDADVLLKRLADERIQRAARTAGIERNARRVGRWAFIALVLVLGALAFAAFHAQDCRQHPTTSFWCRP